MQNVENHFLQNWFEILNILKFSQNSLLSAEIFLCFPFSQDIQGVKW